MLSRRHQPKPQGVETDLVAGPGEAALHALAVDERAVRGSEVFDLDARPVGTSRACWRERCVHPAAARTRARDRRRSGRAPHARPNPSPETPRNTNPGTTGRTAVAPGSSLAGVRKPRRRDAGATRIDGGQARQDAVEGDAVVGTQGDQPVDLAAVDADRRAVRHVQRHAMRIDVQLAVLGKHAGTVDDDVGIGIGADAVDAGPEQDLADVHPRGRPVSFGHRLDGWRSGLARRM